MQTCTHCQAGIPDAARICPFCGRKVQKADDARRRLVLRLHLGMFASRIPPFTSTSQPAPSRIIRPGDVIIAAMLVLANIILVPFLWSSPPPVSTILTVTPHSLNFGKVVSGAKPVQILHVVNSGNQPLKWRANAGNVRWVTLDVSRGTVAVDKKQAINVTIDTSQLSPNKTPHVTTLSFSSNGGNTSTTVQVTVLPRPRTPLLCLDRTSLDFGTMTTNAQQTKTVTVSNCGGESLRWKSDTGGANWITASPDNGSLNHKMQQVVSITLDTSQMSPNVTPQTTSLAFSSNGGNGAVEISVVVVSPPSSPLLCDLTDLNFGAMDQGTTKTLPETIGNCGGQSLDWNTAVPFEAAGWLQVDMTTGTVNPGQQQNINVKVDTGHLPPGVTPYTATFTINSTGGPGTVQVSVLVNSPSPLLCDLSPSPSLDFGQIPQGSPAEAQLTFKNCGNQQLSATLSNGGTDWLSLDGKPSTSRTLDPDVQATINVYADTSLLPPSTAPYTAVISFSTNEPGGGNETVDVSVIVTPPPPKLTVDSPSLDFGLVTGGTSTQQVNVGNSGGQQLNWTATSQTDDGSPWLTIDNTGGTINAGDPTQVINVIVSTAGLKQGQQYNGTITIDSNGGSLQVPVSMTVPLL